MCIAPNTIGLAAVEHDYPDESDTDGGGGADGPHSGNRTAAPRARAATGHGLLERVAGGWFPFRPTSTPAPTVARNCVVRRTADGTPAQGRALLPENGSRQRLTDKRAIGSTQHATDTMQNHRPSAARAQGRPHPVLRASGALLRRERPDRLQAASRCHASAAWCCEHPRVR